MTRSDLAVVTGAARGIGATVARRLAADGYELLLVDRSPAVEAVADDLGGDACVADLAEPGATDAIRAAVEATGRQLRALVNCAGITRDARLEAMTAEQFAQVVDVNLAGPLRLAEGLGPLIADGGSVVSISSRSAFGNFGQANYATSKAGLLGATRALALRWAPRIRVNAVAPGLVETPMTAAMPAEVLDRLVGRIPMGRIGAPGDVADAVAYLASPAASYVTGQVLLVCGGRSVAA